MKFRLIVLLKERQSLYTRSSVVREMRSQCVCTCVIIHREESHPLSKHVPEHTHCPGSLCYHIISFERVWNIVFACPLSCRESASSISLAMEPISHPAPPVTPPTFCYHGGYHADTKGPILRVLSTPLGCFWIVPDISSPSLSSCLHIWITLLSQTCLQCCVACWKETLTSDLWLGAVK